MKRTIATAVVGRGRDCANVVGGRRLKAISQVRREFVRCVLVASIVLVLVSVVAAWEIERDLPFQNAEYATAAN
jgi:hypothetical protein